MIFFFDENIPKYAAYMLAQFDREHQMRASADFFEPGTPDTMWMPVVASWAGDPVVVSGDGRILRNRAERQVLKECGRMFVYLAAGWTKLRWQEFAWRIVRVWPDVTKSIQEARYPMVLEVSGGLKVQSMARIDKL